MSDTQAMQLSAAIRLRVERPENGDAINAMIREARRMDIAVVLLRDNEAREDGREWNIKAAAGDALRQADALLAELGKETTDA